jgi:hypothetical protein
VRACAPSEAVGASSILVSAVAIGLLPSAVAAAAVASAFFARAFALTVVESTAVLTCVCACLRARREIALMCPCGVRVCVCVRRAGVCVRACDGPGGEPATYLGRGLLGGLLRHRRVREHRRRAVGRDRQRLRVATRCNVPSWCNSVLPAGVATWRCANTRCDNTSRRHVAPTRCTNTLRQHVATTRRAFQHVAALQHGPAGFRLARRCDDLSLMRESRRLALGLGLALTVLPIAAGRRLTAI